MFISSQTLFTLLISAASARPPVLKRQVVVWETKQETVTTSSIVATAWQTIGETAPTSAAVLSSVPQVQVVVNEIAAQYTYSSARTVFAIPTVVTSTITQTVQVTEYVSNGVTVTPQATLTTTNTIDAQATPVGSSVGAPVTATLPLVSARIGGATVTVSAQTYTYYTPVIDAVGQKIEAATTLSAAQTLSTATEANIVTGPAPAGVDVTSVAAAPQPTTASSTLATTTSAQFPAVQTSTAQANADQTSSTQTSSSQSTSAKTTSSTTTSAQTTSAQTTSTQTTSTTTAASQSTTIALAAQDTFVSAVLSRINGYRALHGAGALTWDYALAANALSYAQTCTMQPSTDASFGETLAAGTATDPTFYVDLWNNEVSSYDYGAPGFSDATGHFTQLVWKATSVVGCGFSSGCGEYANYLVCRYSSPGNVLGGTNNDQFFIDNVA